MKLLLSTLLLIISACAHAQVQEYKDSVFTYYDHSWKKIETTKKARDKKPAKCTFYRVAKQLPDDTWHIRDYYAFNNTLQMEGISLDDSAERLDGDCIFYHYNGVIERKGAFNKGIRTGLWRSYNQQGKLIDSSRFKSTGMLYYKAWTCYDDGKVLRLGDYDVSGTGAGYETGYYQDGTISEYGKYAKGNVKDSIYTYYHSNGKRSFEATWDAGRLLKTECFDEQGNPTNGNCDTVGHMPEPGYDFNKFLSEHLKMPKAALNADISGRFPVLVQMVVCADGRICEVELEVGSYKEFNEEALRVVKLLPKWKPGRVYNRNVRVYYTLPINFALE